MLLDDGLKKQNASSLIYFNSISLVLNSTSQQPVLSTPFPMASSSKNLGYRLPKSKHTTISPRSSGDVTFSCKIQVSKITSSLGIGDR